MINIAIISNKSKLTGAINFGMIVLSDGIVQFEIMTFLCFT